MLFRSSAHVSGWFLYAEHARPESAPHRGAVDTSGSVVDMVGEFLGHIVAIAQEVCPEEVALLYWDTKVRRDERYDENSIQSMLTSTKPAGGGGTTPTCVPKHLREKELHDADCIVVLTDGVFYDGEGDWTDCTAPLWCVLKDYAPSFKATNGDVLAI